MYKGYFVVFEGINGCGKTTQLKYFRDYLAGLRRPFLFTEEPNDFDENGLRAREMLARDGDPYTNGLEALKYFALNRGTHNEIFVPPLERGVTVLSGRYWDSNFAFQRAQGIFYSKIAKMNFGFRVPDITFLIDIPAEEAMRRLGGRDGDERRKFDSDLDFLRKVRANYLELSEILPVLIRDNSIRVIDGMGEGEEVFGRIRKEFEIFEKQKPKWI